MKKKVMIVVLLFCCVFFINAQQNELLQGAKGNEIPGNREFSPHIQINELFFYPGPANPGPEWVELYNNSSSGVCMQTRDSGAVQSLTQPSPGEQKIPGLIQMQTWTG